MTRDPRRTEAGTAQISTFGCPDAEGGGINRRGFVSEVKDVVFRLGSDTSAELGREGASTPI